MVLLFQILAVALCVAATFFYWRGNYDTMFVTAVIGAAAFFLSIRMQVKTRLDERRAREAETEDPEI